jgi:hypothetical protein
MRPVQVNRHQPAITCDIVVDKINAEFEGRVESLDPTLQRFAPGNIATSWAVRYYFGVDDGIPSLSLVEREALVNVLGKTRG